MYGANGVLSYVRREDGDTLRRRASTLTRCSRATVATDGSLVPMLSTLGAPCSSSSLTARKFRFAPAKALCCGSPLEHARRNVVVDLVAHAARRLWAVELITSLLTEALVKRGVDVTLFATLNSVTAGKLDGIVPHGYSEGPGLDAKVAGSAPRRDARRARRTSSTSFTIRPTSSHYSSRA